VLVSLNLPAGTTIAALSREAMLDGAALRRRLARHDDGVYVLSQQGRLDDLDRGLVDRLPQLLAGLRQSFDVVVIDGVTEFSDHALCALDAADEVVLVVTQDVAAVRRAARVVEYGRMLGYPPGKLRLVVNRYERRRKITVNEIQRALSLDLLATVGNHYKTAQRAQDAGAPVAAVKRRSKLAREMNRLGERLGAAAPDPAAMMAAPRIGRGGIFGWLFGRG
jgi:pilus assembly protein CpaE